MPRARTTAVKLDRPDFHLMEVRVESVARGLLTNAIPAQVVEGLGLRQEGKPEPAREPRDRDLIVKEACYHLHPPREEAEFGLPMMAFLESVMAAAYGPNANSRRAAKFKAGFGLVMDPDELVPILSEDPPLSRQDTGRNNKTRGGASLIVLWRPWWPKWSAVLHVEHDPAIVTAAEVIATIDCAGAWVGVGAWRPGLGSRSGFGLFRVAKQ